MSRPRANTRLSLSALTDQLLSRTASTAYTGTLIAWLKRLDGAIRGELENVTLNGPPADRLPGNLSLSFGGVDGERLISSLRDLAVSSGSACTTASAEPSHVLRSRDHRIMAGREFAVVPAGFPPGGR